MYEVRAYGQQRIQTKVHVLFDFQYAPCDYCATGFGVGRRGFIKPSKKLPFLALQSLQNNNHLEPQNSNEQSMGDGGVILSITATAAMLKV